jgi:hypothetical protein
LKTGNRAKYITPKGESIKQLITLPCDSGAFLKQGIRKMSTMLLSTLPKQLITVELREEGIHAKLEELHVNTVLQESANRREVLLIVDYQVRTAANETL